MPFVTITKRGSWSGDEGAELSAQVSKTIRELLQHPESPSVRLETVEPRLWCVPPDAGAAFYLVEVSLLVGRSVSVRERLHAEIFGVFAERGVQPGSVRTILTEMEPVNYGLAGGRPASRAKLPYEVGL